MASVFELKRQFFDLLFPLSCFGCGSEGLYLCPGCRSLLRFIPPSCIVCGKLSPGNNRIPPGRTCLSCQEESPLYAFLSPLSYGEVIVRALIHGLKYDRIRSLDSVLARILAEYIGVYRLSFPEGSVIFPIPLHPSRKRTRGFNQSESIAKVLGASLGILVRDDILAKIKSTTPQIAFSREERLRNVNGTFGVRMPEAVKGKTILLLDDVKTTGATLEEAARVLKNAGAGHIWAITIAH